MQTYQEQPYRQLAGYYRESGNDDRARRVLLHSRRRRNARAPAVVRPIGWLYDAFSGYGYAPRRTAYWFAAAVLAGLAYLATRETDPIRGFNGLMTSLDLVLPTSPFGLESGAAPHDDSGRLVWFWLQALGWVLSLSIGPTITRALSRDQSEVR
jgi:hypothetical protein